MSSGVYSKRITIQKPNTQQDSVGYIGDEWTNIATVWANINIGSGREFYAASKVNCELSGIIKIRYRSGIEADMRIIYNGRVFDLLKPPINVEEKNTEIELHVKEVL